MSETSSRGAIHEGTGRCRACGALVLFGLFFVLGLVLPLVGGGMPLKARSLLPVAGIFFALLWLRALRGLATAASRFLLDEEGMRRQRLGREVNVAWKDVADVEVRQNALAGGAWTMTLLGTDRRPLLRIDGEFLADNGAAFLAELQDRLQPLFLRQAEGYLSGARHWAFGPIRDVVRFEGRRMFTEYPAKRRSAFPVDSIERVEMVPKELCRTLQPVHLRLDHTRGVIRIPLRVPGIHLLPFVLKHAFGLGAVVDAGLPAAAVAERRRLGAGLRSRMRARVFAAVAAAGVAALGIGIGLDANQRHQARTLGTLANAEVIAKKNNASIVLRYRDIEERQYESRTRVTPEFHRGIREGDYVAIRVHPGLPREYWFEERWRPGRTEWLAIGSLAGLLAVAALGLAAYGFGGVSRIRQRLEELDRAYPRIAASAPSPLPAPVPVAAAEDAATRRSPWS